jgi:hypothetical protein
MDRAKKTFGFRAIEFLYQLIPKPRRKRKTLSSALGAGFNEDTPFDFPCLYVTHTILPVSQLCMLATAISGNSYAKILHLYLTNFPPMNPVFAAKLKCICLDIFT